MKCFKETDQMQKITTGIVAAFACVLMLIGTGTASAESTVTLKGVHLCCGGCVKGVGKALTSAGVKGKCDAKAGTVAITAADKAGIDKAVAALGEAGYYGKADGVKFAATKNVPTGKVKSITLIAGHNCCGKCSKAIVKAAKSVGGTTKAKAKVAEFTVEGDFEAAALIKALNDAGLSVKVKS
jgi:mercuric ion binding protein